MLLKFDHVCTSVDLRLHFKNSFNVIHVETGSRSTIRHVKVAVIQPSKEAVCVYLVKNCSMRERGEPGAMETKVIMPRKIVPYKCCLPSPNISLKKEFDTEVLF